MRKITEKSGKLYKYVKKRWLVFLAGIISALAGIWLINIAAQPFSKAQYCASCHEMQPLYETWKQSVHYKNPSGTVTQCVDCHLPPKDNFFVHYSSKAWYGGKDLYKHHFGGKYDPNEMRQLVIKNMPNDRCLNCHASLMSNPVSPPASRIAHEIYFDPHPPADANIPSCLDCHYSPQLFHWRQ